jgi:uncharacterized protein (DUF433 family)
MNLILESPTLPLKTDRDGVIRVGGTRVTLESVVAAFKNGATAEQIAHDYPVVDLADVYAVITYYLRHRAEVEQYVAEQRQEGAQIRAEMEARFDPQGIRDRLLARRAKKDSQDASTAGG